MSSNYNGRALLTQAKQVMKNLKKAISIAETWTKRNGGSVTASSVSCGSGRTVDSRRSLQCSAGRDVSDFEL